MPRIRVKVNEAAIARLLTSRRVVAEVERRTKAIEDACNAESSWGGYKSEVHIENGTPVGRVWSIAEHGDDSRTTRGQRMIRNLDAR